MMRQEIGQFIAWSECYQRVDNRPTNVGRGKSFQGRSCHAGDHLVLLMETFHKSEQNPGVDSSSKQGRNVIPGKMTRIFRRIRENTLEPYLALFLRCAPNSERRPHGPCIRFETDNVRESRT